VIFLGAMMGFWFFITQFLQGVLEFSPFQAGLAFLPMTLSNFATAMAVPRLTGRFGNARLLAFGLALTIGGMAWLAQLHVGVPYLVGMALPMLLVGIGQGCTLSPLTVAGIAGASPEDAGAASGAVNVAHQLGGSLGLGFLVAVASLAGSAAVGAQAQLAHRASAALAAGTGMLVLALVLVLALIVPKEISAK
jgi:hypothetical protein